jgi:hypothetical protein
LENRFQELTPWEKERNGGGKCGDLGQILLGKKGNEIS